MTSTSALQTPPRIREQTAPVLFLPLLLVLFVGSGCAALIYEIVWFQLLEFSIGSSAYSIGVLLGTFMGGMCLGSLLFSRLVSTRFHPLRIYAMLELGVGVFAILINWAMPLLDHLYAALAQPGAGAIKLRALVCTLCLLPPTMLMGATLPAISRWIKATPRGVAWLGFFYGGNTVGAVAGCLLAGFWLLPTFNMTLCTHIAALINFVVAALALSLSASSPSMATADSREAQDAPEFNAESRRWLAVFIYVAIALSGMSALGAEVVWTRLLSLLLGPTVYTFSIILAVFLAGLAGGSSVGSMIARTGNARAALSWCQLLCAGTIAWSAYAITNGLPNWPVSNDIVLRSHFKYELDLARCCWAILPATVFWGASFPLALAAAASLRSARDGGKTGDPARVVGAVYAANTVGAIFGALVFSLWAIETIGTQSSQRALIVLASLGALAAAIPAMFPQRRQSGETQRAMLTGMALTLLAAFTPWATIQVLQVWNLDKLPWELVAWGRRVGQLQPEDRSYQLLYMGEGMNSSVAVTQNGSYRYFHVAGKVEASSLPQDMRLQLMLGHFPALIHPAPKKVLIVGCGAGVTAGSFVVEPGVERIVICEIEPLVPKVVATYFSRENNSVVTRDQSGKLISSKVEIVYDDARHYILTTKEKFDIITSDPIHPWVKGAASLYTREYFDLVKQHLNPGGLVTQWVPLYESNSRVVKTEVRTFFDAFPHGLAWCNDADGGGYDVVVMGSPDPLRVDVPELQKRMGNLVLSGILGDVGFQNATDILRTYGGQASDLRNWAADAPINSDRDLRLQYLAGDALNMDEAASIRSDMRRFITYPADLIAGQSAEQRAVLQSLCAPARP